MLSVIILVSQLGLFEAIALYLHYLSDHYGFSLLLFFLAGIMGILNIIEVVTLFVEPIPGIVIRPGGHVYVPIILLIVLLVYITSGTRTARIVIAGLTGINALILSALIFLLLYLNVRDPATPIRGLFAEANILTPLFMRGVVASTLTFMVNMFVIIIIYQGINNAFPGFPKAVIPGVALLMALWVDAILYNILAFLGTPNFVQGIPSDVVLKTGAGILLAPLAGWYLTRVAPKLTSYQGVAKRSTLVILFGEGGFNPRLIQLENELRVSRAIYEQLMQHIGEIFWLVDVEQARLLYLSPAFEKITGKPRETYYNAPGTLLELLHPDDRMDGSIRRMLASSETEFRIRRPDGSIRWLRNRAFPIVTQDQEVVRYAGITEDITLRKEMQAKDLALALSREKVTVLQNFVREASHDLRSPLSTILLKLYMMDKVDSARQKELQGEISDSVQRLSSMIEDLFTLSHLESSSYAEVAEVDLNDIVRQVANNQHVIAQQKGLKLRLELIDTALPISGNRNQLVRLVSNLIENAIHYTPQGQVTVRTLISDQQAVLEVADTGMGIPEAQLDAIFERFYRTEKARTIRNEGTGLGLAISKAIVDQHQGAISVESKVEQGSTFRVTFALAQSPQGD